MLQRIHRAQRLNVVVEAFAVPLHHAVERLFARMREGRMPHIVHQRKRLREVFVQTQNIGGRARDLRHFDGVGQAVSKMVGERRREDLRLMLEAPKRPRMNDAVPVSLKGVAVRVLRLRVTTAARRLDRKPEVFEHCPEVIASEVPEVPLRRCR